MPRARWARSCTTARRWSSAVSRARIATPLLVKLDAADGAKYLKEWFGPIAFLIATDDTAQSLDIARRAVVEHGALTLSLYSKRPDVIEDTIALAADAGVALSIDLTGGVFVPQAADVSKCLGAVANRPPMPRCDSAFVAGQFRSQHRGTSRRHRNELRQHIVRGRRGHRA
jgi:hypothetical protein